MTSPGEWHADISKSSVYQSYRKPTQRHVLRSTAIKLEGSSLRLAHLSAAYRSYAAKKKPGQGDPPFAGCDVITSSHYSASYVRGQRQHCHVHEILSLLRSAQSVRTGAQTSLLRPISVYYKTSMKMEQVPNTLQTWSTQN
jgi:hypothetical protein